MLTKLKILENVDKLENIGKMLTKLKMLENVDKLENIGRCANLKISSDLLYQN